MYRKSIARLPATVMVAALIAVGCGTGDDPEAEQAVDAETDAESGAASEGDEDPGESDEAPSESDGDLVIEGEMIADAELWEAALEEGQLRFYTALNEEDELYISDAFTEDTGVEVELVRLPGTRLDERIRTEYGSGITSADVVHQSDTTTNVRMLEDGIGVPYSLPEYLEGGIPEEHIHPDGAYVSVTVTPMAFAYNNMMLDESEAPASWADLLDPRWEGQIIMPYAGIGGSGWSMALFQRQELGEDYWSELKAQNPVIGQSAAGIGEEVGRGEYAVAINAAPSTETVISTGAPITVVWPEEGSPAYGNGMSLADGENPNAAKLYINWASSLRGAQFLTDRGRYSTHPDAPAPIGGDGERMDDLSVVNPVVATSDDWIELRDQWVDEWNEVYEFSE